MAELTDAQLAELPAALKAAVGKTYAEKNVNPWGTEYTYLDSDGQILGYAHEWSDQYGSGKSFNDADYQHLGSYFEDNWSKGFHHTSEILSDGVVIGYREKGERTEKADGDADGDYTGEVSKTDFIYDINDEVEYLYDSDYFHKNKSTLFTVENSFHNDLLNKNTRNYKNNITIGGDIGVDEIILTETEMLDDINDLFDNVNNEVDVSGNNHGPELFYEGKIEECNDDNSSESCSSRSSNSDNGDNGDCSDDCSDDDSMDSTLSDEVINVNIKAFPVQLIALERCNDTLDALIASDVLTDDELSAIVVQILMMLITYQKIFSFTHNDLHTNNIMYIKTEKQYLYYKYNDKYYKVPTFGKIFKLIDFGRAIYKFRGNTICSDSYHPEGDAATQYNCEPYLNDNKPRLEPNNSFDLCRLGCSLFDYYVDDLENVTQDKSEIINIIIKWCYDDKNRNILYKTNGDERYPDFKLYKMIARTVNNHVPSKVLQYSHFNRFIISKKKNNKSKLINIDTMKEQI